MTESAKGVRETEMWKHDCETVWPVYARRLRELRGRPESAGAKSSSG